MKTDPEGREERIARAVAEYLDRQNQDEPIDPAVFCRLHPELQPDLGLQLQQLDSLDLALLQDQAGSGSGQGAEPVPERLSGHRILSEIGSGGMGRVFLALDERLNRRVAIKSLASRFAARPTLRERFLREAQALARLSHPHVVRIYGLGPPEEIPHFVMEFVEGRPLTEVGEKLTLEQKVELVRKLALAVDFLHRNGIIHRDLKPGNVLVGADLEPKLLDFGLAAPTRESGQPLTLPGDLLGTPEYFSPEQARGDDSLGAPSDVFSLGVIFYELLTGRLPFRGLSLEEQRRAVCEEVPELPRRLNRDVPGELQNVCMKALEKSPGKRYLSARDMAADLDRFLAGEKVIAAPSSYAQVMAGKIEQHVGDLESWRDDRILSDEELDSFHRLYDRLIEREDTWIMGMRRFGFPQVSLYLGAWLFVLGATLILLFHHPTLEGTPSVLLVASAAAITTYFGWSGWRRGHVRNAIAFLLAACLLVPITMLMGMVEWKWLTAPSLGDRTLELFSGIDWMKAPTNAQLWWALALALPFHWGVRRFTHSSVFSLVMSAATASLCLVTLLRMGMLRWLAEDQGQFYLRLLPCAALFFVLGFVLERSSLPADSRYFYPAGVLFTLAALSGTAAYHAPYARWLGRVLPVTRGEPEYLFIINAGAYFVLQRVFERVPSPQMRSVAKSFRFFVPGHVLAPLWLLGLSAESLWRESPASVALRHETRFFEVLLPLAACAFVLGSIPKQMKNFLASGLIFLAVGLVRLQQELFAGRAILPIGVLIVGLAVMLLATRYSAIKMTLSRWRRGRTRAAGDADGTTKITKATK
jgi:serine/threonine protein kinase